MGSVQLDNKEWDAFLEKLSELERKYLLVLRELDEARSRLNGLEKPPKEIEHRSPEKEVPNDEKLSRKEPEDRGRSVIVRLRTELRSLLTFNGLQRCAVCSRCRHRITHASRFCEHCGADFGMLVCACGREILASDKFCDRCGRSLDQEFETLRSSGSTRPDHEKQRRTGEPGFELDSTKDTLLQAYYAL